MPALAQKLRNFRPQPTPAQQEVERLQIEKLKLENQELLSLIELNQAKAQQVTANRDKTNLDFVEQETGTKHARDMQKQKAQSRGNQNLQITKAIASPIKEGEKRPDISAALGFNELSDRLEGDDPVMRL